MIYSHERKERRYTGPRPAMPPQDASLWDEMADYLGERDLSYSVARGNLWYPISYDGSRILIPCSNSAGIPYWQARAIDDSKVRYQSPKATRDDSIVLVWPSEAFPHGTVLVEGPMDALAAAGQGFIGIAFMGNQPPPAALEFARSKVEPPILIVPDLDSPEFGIKLVTYFGDKFKTILHMPIRKDLCEMSQCERKKLLKGE